MQSDAQAIGVHRDVAHRQMQAAQLLLLLSAQGVQRPVLQHVLDHIRAVGAEHLRQRFGGSIQAHLLHLHLLGLYAGGGRIEDQGAAQAFRSMCAEHP